MSSPSDDNGPLDVPKWVPSSVGASANELYLSTLNENCPDHSRLIRRLTSHPDMKYVWQELRKKNRKTETFVYRLRIDVSGLIGPKNSVDRHHRLRELAFKKAFLTAVRLGKLSFGGSDIADTRISSVRRLRNHFEQVVDYLSETYSNEAVPAQYSRLKRAGLELINALEKVAAEPAPFNPKTLADIAVCIGLSQKLNGLFVFEEGIDKDASKEPSTTRPRPPLSGLVARLASVILDRPINRDQVRDWQDGYWGGGFSPP